MLVKMTAVCPCSDSKHYRQTVFMALITALKAAFLRARRGLAQVFAAFHASTRFLPVRLRLCACEYARKANGKRGKMFNRARVLKVGYCGYRCVVALLLCVLPKKCGVISVARCFMAVSFCEVLNSNAPRLCCGGNGVTEGNSEG